MNTLETHKSRAAYPNSEAMNRAIPAASRLPRCLTWKHIEMLGFLPAPIGDELLYSLLARFRVMSGTPISKPILEAAFGRGERKISIMHPLRLENLASQLPGHILQPVELIERHTAFPYFRHFFDESTSTRVRIAMERGMGGEGCGNPWLAFSSVARHERLNFCPECIKADVEIYGEAAWRRTHQLPGVFVCPEHRVTLRVSAVKTSEQTRLEPCPTDAEAGTLIQNPLEYSIAVQIAEASQWLLLNPGGPTNPMQLRSAVRTLLRDAGWIDRAGRVCPGFRDAFARHFGKDNLAALGCPVTTAGKSDAWMGNLWTRADRIQNPPFRYLLLLAFLGKEPADLYWAASSENDEYPTQTARPAASGNQALRPDLIEMHRRHFLAALQEYPNRSRTEIRRALHCTRYLAKHDPAWLSEHLPDHRSKGNSNKWPKMDMELATKARTVIQRLMTAPDRPRRITLSFLAQEMCARDVIRRNRKRLPKTMMAISQGIEKSEARLDAGAERETDSHAERACGDFLA